MRTSGISLVLAITLLTAGASVAPATCCVPKTSRTVQAMDCCDTMVVCPTIPEAGSFAVVSSSDAATAALALVLDSPGEPAPERRITKLASAETLPDKPPLYRLHAQLLI